MTRKEEIIQTAHQKEKEVGFSQFVHEAKGVNSSYGIGFLEGAEWADNHPNLTWEGVVKEVDLENEIDKWYNNEASKEFEDVLYSDIEKFAKHFFELGLLASNKAEKEVEEEPYVMSDTGCYKTTTK